MQVRTGLEVKKALSPRGLREKRFSAVLSWRCASWLVFRDARGAAGRDVRPAAQFLSFAPPKERNQRKGGPLPATPMLRIGAAAVLDPGAAPRNSLRGRPLRSNSRGGSVYESGVSFGSPACPGVCAPWRRQKGWATEARQLWRCSHAN